MHVHKPHGATEISRDEHRRVTESLSFGHDHEQAGLHAMSRFGDVRCVSRRERLSCTANLTSAFDLFDY